MDEATDVCAMITTGQAERVESWIREAERGGRAFSRRPS